MQTIMKMFAEYKGDRSYMDYLDGAQEKLGKVIQELCWDGDRFIRGITEKGEIIGKCSYTVPSSLLANGITSSINARFPDSETYL